MKRKTIFRILGIAALALFVAAVCGVELSLEAFGGATMATVAVVGAVTGGTASVTELVEAGIAEDDIDKKITKFSPSKYPLDTITRAVKSKAVKSQVVKFYQKSSKPFIGALDSAASGSGTSSGSPCKAYTLDVSAGSADTGIAQVYVQVVEPKLWRVADTVLVKDATLYGAPGAAVFAPGSTNSFKTNQMFYVKSKDETVLCLIPIGGMKGKAGSPVADSFIVPSFTEATVLVRMGQAKKETDLTSDPISILPVASENYCQNFITQVEESTFANLTLKEVDVDITDFDRDNIESMRGEMELSFLFGSKGKIEGANGDTVYFTGGITNEITKKVTYGSGGADRSMSAEDYMTMLQEVFIGTNGSSQRVMLCGSAVIKAVELLRESQKNVSGNSVQETYHGVVVTKLVSTFGTIRLAHHPLFDEIGFEDRALILDMEYVERKPFVPLIAKELDLKSSGQKNANARTLQECSCLTLRYPDCHAWVVPKE